MIGHTVRREASVSGPNNRHERAFIASSNSATGSFDRRTASGPSSIHTIAELGRPS